MRRVLNLLLPLLMGSMLTFAAAAPAEAATPILVKRDAMLPAAAGAWMVWTRNGRDGPDVLAQTGNRSPFRLNPPGTNTSGAGISGDTVIYARSPSDGGDSDLYRYNLLTRKQSLVRASLTRADEGFPTISGRWILFGRSSRKAAHSAVLLLNRWSGELSSIAKGTSEGTSSSMVQAGQVNGGYATWTRFDQNAEHSDVFRYSIADGTSAEIATAAGILTQEWPSVTPGGTVFFERQTAASRAQLVAAPIAGPLSVITVLPRGAYCFYNTFARSNDDGTVTLFFTRSFLDGSVNIYAATAAGSS